MKKYAPIQLQKRAQAWINIYNFNISSKNNEIKANAIVCFFFGFEFYLKALLVVLNKDFQDGERLKKIGHNFEKIYYEIKKCATIDLIKETEKVIKNFNLFDVNVVDLRYPQIDT